MKYVHQLALILMKSLYLHIKDGARIHIDPVVLLDVFRKAYFILVLDIQEFLLALLIIGIDLQLLDMRKVCDPLIPDLGGDPVGQKGIAVKQEPSLRNAVCLVIKLFRHHLVKILQFLVL